MKLHVWETEKHMQINEFMPGSVDDFLAFQKDLREKYMGFVLDFCYHNSPIPVEYMRKLNAQLLESCIETRLSPDNFTPYDVHMTTLITNKNFAEFAALHDAAHPASSGMYWTSERINDLSRWLIYVYEHSYILMSMWDHVPEIYALESTDSNIKKSLISTASKYAFNSGKTGILNMIEDNDTENLEIVKSLGFIPCGKYIAYRTVIT